MCFVVPHLRLTKPGNAPTAQDTHTHDRHIPGRGPASSQATVHAPGTLARHSRFNTRRSRAEAARPTVSPPEKRGRFTKVHPLGRVNSA